MQLVLQAEDLLSVSYRPGEQRLLLPLLEPRPRLLANRFEQLACPLILLYPTPDVTLCGVRDVLHVWASLFADTQTPGYMLPVLDRTTALGVPATSCQAYQRAMDEAVGPIKKLMELAAGLAIFCRESFLMSHENGLLCRVLLYRYISESSTKMESF